jgi:hypothetical protein
MYEVGKVYTWHSIEGRYAYLNGTETVITGRSMPFLMADGSLRTLQPTSTRDPDDGATVAACAGYLRPKVVPSGERETMALFAEPMLPRSTSGDAKEKTADAMLAQLRRMLRFQRKGF